MYFRYLEHVVSPLFLYADRNTEEQFKRGHLRIYLISPSGTRSTLLGNRPYDFSTTGFTNWPFMTTHSWGENPIGKWTLEIYNDDYSFVEKKTDFFIQWSLQLFGTDTDPNFKRPEDDYSNRNIQAGDKIRKYLLSKILKG